MFILEKTYDSIYRVEATRSKITIYVGELKYIVPIEIKEHDELRGRAKFSMNLYPFTLIAHSEIYKDLPIDILDYSKFDLEEIIDDILDKVCDKVKPDEETWQAN